MGICIWATVMDKRGEHERQRGAVIMTSFAGEAGGVRMIRSKCCVPCQHLVPLRYSLGLLNSLNDDI